MALGGGTTTFTVHFDPSGGGLRTATVSIANNDGDENPYDFAIQGDGTEPEIDVQGGTPLVSIPAGDTTPQAADGTDFGDALVAGGTVDRTFTIANTGTAPLNLTGTPKVTITGDPDFTVTVQPTSPVAPSGGTTTFTVHFDPSVAGPRTATVSIANNDGDENPYDFVIQGTGTAPEMDVQGGTPLVSIPDADTTPQAADGTDFGDALVPGGTVDHTFTVANTGTADLNLTGTPKVDITGTHAADFTVTVQPTSPVASGGGTTTFTVHFAPSGGGLRTATISIANNDSDENPYDFVIQGTGTAPEMDVQGGTPLVSIPDGDTTPQVADGTDFGSADITTGSVDRTFTIENTGTADLDLTGTPKLDITGTHAVDFSVTVQPTSPVASGGGTTTFTVHFDPSAAGLRTATVSIANNDADENPYDFVIQGTGSTAAEMAVKGGTPLVEIPDNDTEPSTTDGTDFGSALVDGGSVDHTFTIENTGTADLDLTGTPEVNITGTHAADFSVTVQPTSPVAPGGGTTTFTVRFDPTGGGLRTATISISNTEADENPYDFAIQGTGIAPEINIQGGTPLIDIADGNTSPQAADGTDFGNVLKAGGKVSKTYTIQNLGTANLIVNGGTPVTITGAHAADFTVTTQPTSPVAPSNTTTFTLEFDPSALGLRTATVNIVNSDADENPYDFTIQGTGTEPDIAANPTTKDYGNVEVTKSASQKFWVKNEGSADLHVTGEALVGGDNTEFNIDKGQVPFTLASGDSHDVDVSFNPTTLGAKATTLQFSSDDPDEDPFNVPLNGNAIPIQRTLTMAVNPAGGGTTVPAVGDTTVNDGAVVNLKANAAAGWRFVNWTGDVADPNSANTTVTMNADKSVTANFVRAYTLTMAVDPVGGGTTVPALGDTVVTDGSVVNIKATANPGFLFVNWTGAGIADPNSANTTVTVTGSQTVTAHFVPTHTLTMAADPAGAGTTIPTLGDTTVAHGTAVPIKAIPANGFVFANWVGAGVANPNSPQTTVTVNGDQTVTAHFVPGYTLTMAVNPAGSGQTVPAVGDTAVAVGEVIPIKANAAPGWKFVNWTGTEVADPNSANTTVTVNANKTVTANFEVSEYSLTMAVNAPGDGTTTPAVGVHKYNAGTVVNIKATPNLGNEFVNWTGDVANPNSASTTVTMNDNKVVTANFRWARATLTISSSPTGGGTTDPPTGAHEYLFNEVVTITATPAAGYRFVNWTGDVENPASATTTVRMNGSKTVMANFTRDFILTMAVDPVGKGTTTPAVGTHAYAGGTIVPITATPASGYRFVNWTGGVADPNSASTTVTIDGDKTVTAHFIKQCTLTVAVNPAGSGTTVPAVGTHVYDLGTVVNLSVTPGADYRFVSWTGNVGNPNNASTTVTMDDNKTVTANLSLKDRVPPYLTNVFPAPGATNICKNTNIQFKAKDNGMGVGLNTLNATVNGTAIVTNGVDRTGGRVTITSHSPAFTVKYDPASDFAEGSTVTVNAKFDDLESPANHCDSTYAFTIGKGQIDTNTTTGTVIGQGGGTAADTTKKVEVTIPANALEDSVEITISKVDSLPPLPPGVTGLALSYHFGPDGLQFSDSVLVRIPYTQEDLDNAGVTRPEDLGVYYYHTTTGVWINLRIVNVDAVNLYIFVKIKEFCYITYGTGSTGVEELRQEGVLPAAFNLSQNYPNPFNPETRICYEVPKSAHVHLAVYDLMGRLIRTLVNEQRSVGLYEVIWDGRNETGDQASTGIYFFVMKSGSQVLVRKMALVK